MSSSPVPPNTVFSVVLPWVNPGHQEGFLRETFEKSGWGEILKVDWSLRKHSTSGREFFVVYIHFGTFPNAEWKNFLANGGELKVFFNPRNFWKVRASRWSPRPPAPVFVPHVEFPVRVHSVHPVPMNCPPPCLPPDVEANIQNEMEEVLDAIAAEHNATDEEVDRAAEEFVVENEIHYTQNSE